MLTKFIRGEASLRRKFQLKRERNAAKGNTEFVRKVLAMIDRTASSRDTWRGGVLFSRSGLMAVTETEHFLGTALAIQEINQAGGIRGRGIQGVAYDPGSDPQNYRKLARRRLT